jgi:hypothetical protein
VVVNRFFRRLVDSVVNFHNSSLVTASVTVIGSGKDSDNGPVVLPLVSFHHQLVRTGDKVQTVNVRKLLGNILSKGVSRAPW